jgi:hypothetical protein
MDGGGGMRFRFSAFGRSEEQQPVPAYAGDGPRHRTPHSYRFPAYWKSSASHLHLYPAVPVKAVQHRTRCAASWLPSSGVENICNPGIGSLTEGAAVRNSEASQRHSPRITPERSAANNAVSQWSIESRNQHDSARLSFPVGAWQRHGCLKPKPGLSLAKLVRSFTRRPTPPPSNSASQ